jgi:hypothetical protein
MTSPLVVTRALPIAFSNADLDAYCRTRTPCVSCASINFSLKLNVDRRHDVVDAVDVASEASSRFDIESLLYFYLSPTGETPGASSNDDDDSFWVQTVALFQSEIAAPPTLNAAPSTNADADARRARASRRDAKRRARSASARRAGVSRESHDDGVGVA